MKIWKIWANLSNELEILYIQADSFDEALVTARRIDTRYNSGQLQ